HSNAGLLAVLRSRRRRTHAFDASSSSSRRDATAAFHPPEPFDLASGNGRIGARPAAAVAIPLPSSSEDGERGVTLDAADLVDDRGGVEPGQRHATRLRPIYGPGCSWAPRRNPGARRAVSIPPDAITAIPRMTTAPAQVIPLS